MDTSLVSGENYRAAIEMLEPLVKQAGFETETIKIPKEIGGPNRVNLIGKKFSDPKLPTLIIYNHIDVVPASYQGAFEPKIVDGKIYARGAADSKGNTFAVIEALSSIKDKKLRFNLIFLATTDEETSQINQLRFLKSKLNLDKASDKGFIILDVDTFAGGVTVASLGQLGLEIEVVGKSAHSGMSDRGQNAVEDAAGLINFLAEIKNEFEARKSKYLNFKSVSADFLCGRCNVNMIEGGTAGNIVPDLCKIHLDVRFIPEDDVVEGKNKLLERVKEFCDREKIEYRVNQLSSIQGNYCNHPLVNELSRICQEISGEGGLYGASGSTDVSQWSGELGLPHFGLGVVRAENNIHGENEFVYIQDMENMSQILQKFLSA